MSTTSKSPRRVLLVAYATAKNSLPAYAHRFSPKKFTQYQLFACLVLKTFMRTDYRGIVEILRDCPELAQQIDLEKIPHYTTLQKASKRLLRLPVANQLLEATMKIQQENTNKKENTNKIELAAMDSTGFQAGHTSSYFVKRRSRSPGLWQTTTYTCFPKLAVTCDCHTHMVLSMKTSRGPSPDVNEFCDSLEPAAARYAIDYLLADAGYDSESNHCYARDILQIETIIPAKHGRPTDKLPKGKYRRKMKYDFDSKRYGQRWQVETVFSMIKRNQGETLYARSVWAQNREMLLKVLTHNIAILLLVKALFYRADLTPLFPLLCLILEHLILAIGVDRPCAIDKVNAFIGPLVQLV